MKVLQKSRELMRKWIDVSYRLGQYAGEIRKLKNPRRKRLINQVQLTEAQKKEIDQFYMQNYGKRIRYDWHRLYQSFTGRFSAQYFPEVLFSVQYEPKVNPEAYRYVLDDKLMLDIFTAKVKGVRTPKTIATYCNGVYFDDQHCVYSKEDLAKKLADCGDVVFKHVQDTSSGRGVKSYSFHQGVSGEEGIQQVIESFSKSAFIVQERIRPHEALKALHADSINTFRIVTYLWQGKVWHFPVALRIGQGGNFLDNAHAGGMFIAVSDEGELADTAYTEFQDTFRIHPDSKVVFAGYRLPFVPELIEAAHKLHLSAPQLGVISWDLTVNDRGEFILIEANTNGQTVWFPQMASGKPAFGENTAAVLRSLRGGQK